MSIENVYSYLEYLALAVDQLGDAVMEREEETAVYEARIREMGDALIQAQKEIDKAEARAQLAESAAAKLDAKLQEMTLIAKTAKQQKGKLEGQTDLFGAPSSPAIPSAPSRPARVANDENALILAKRLDSTIDKVQKLIREAKA